MAQYFVFGVLLAVIFGPMVYRMATPVPPADLRAFEVFVKDRGQTLVSMRKFWIGGPAIAGGRGIYRQVGRPYRVTARSGDGSFWTHDLAVVGTDPIGNPKLQERISGYWSPVIQ